LQTCKLANIFMTISSLSTCSLLGFYTRGYPENPYFSNHLLPGLREKNLMIST
jgi:hypothetical protein